MLSGRAVYVLGLLHLELRRSGGTTMMNDLHGCDAENLLAAAWASPYLTH
jgi:hypothetical protein